MGVFSGIVESSVDVLESRSSPAGLRLVLRLGWTDLKLGESVAVNGACLTVAEFLDGDSGVSSSSSRGRRVGFDVIPETLGKTNLGRIRVGDRVHVERALVAGARLDGHVVQGHVDATAELVRQVRDPSDWRLVGRVPMFLSKYLLPKGSICLDGVSLTLARVSGPWFEVALIPTTLAITQLGRREEGWPLNVECDVMVKAVVETVERALAHREAGLKAGTREGVTDSAGADEAPDWAREGRS